MQTFDVISSSTAFAKAALVALAALLARPAPYSATQGPLSPLAALRRSDLATMAAEDASLTAEYRYRDLVAAVLVDDVKPTYAEIDAAKRAKETAQAALERRYAAEAQLVATAISRADIKKPREVTEAALVSVLHDFRRASGKRGALVRFDNACPEIFRDQVLFDLAEGIVRDHHAQYTAALGRFAQALGCMNLIDDLHVSAKLLTAYDKALTRFPVEKVASAKKALQSALANTFLIVHDDIKHVGLNHAHHWLASNQTDLVKVFTESWSVPRQAGLWFKSPAGDHLVQVPELCEENRGSPDCVWASEILDMLTDGRRLGLATCSAMEMMETGACDQGLCAGDDSAGQRGLAAMSETPVPFRPDQIPEGFMPVFESPDNANGAADGSPSDANGEALGYVPKAGHTRYGAELSAFGALCGSSGEGEDGGGGGASRAWDCMSSALTGSSPEANDSVMECLSDTASATARTIVIGRSWPEDACTVSSTTGGQDPEALKKDDSARKTQEAKEKAAKEKAKQMIEPRRS